jgi:hypothetical protein
MGHYPFTLFNGVTVLALMLVWRRGGLRNGDSPWILLQADAVRESHPVGVCGVAVRGIAVDVVSKPSQIRATIYLPYQAIGAMLEMAWQAGATRNQRRCTFDCSSM